MVLRRVSLVLSLITAGPPAAFAVVLVLDAQYTLSVVFAVLAAFIIALQEYILRSIPHPREYIAARVPWRDDS